MCVNVFTGAGGEMQAYQIRSSSSALPQTVVMTSPVISSQAKSDDPQMKREIRLAKNRSVSLTSKVSRTEKLQKFF